MHLIRTRRYEQLLAKMSKRLRGDSSLVVATRAFKRVSYLSHPDLEPEFLCNLTIRFKLAVYSRLERINTTHLFLVDRGVCAKKGKIALVGACLGEDMIITNPHLRDVSDAIALTFVQTVFLTREAIFELLPEFRGHTASFVARRIALPSERFIVQAAEEGMKAAGRAFGKGGIGAKQAMLDQINAEEEARSARSLRRRSRRRRRAPSRASTLHWQRRARLHRRAPHPPLRQRPNAPAFSSLRMCQSRTEAAASYARTQRRDRLVARPNLPSGQSCERRIRRRPPSTSRVAVWL